MTYEDMLPCPKTFKWDKPDIFSQAQNNESVLRKMEFLEGLNLNSKDDVTVLNNELIETIQEVAGLSLSKKSGRRSNRNPWFDWDCRKSKRRLKKFCDQYTKSPLNSQVRERYYTARKEHRNLITSKKYAYVRNLNYDIEYGNRSINWSEFKKLKQFHSDDDIFDVHDLYSFYQFFQKLYSGNSGNDVAIPVHFEPHTQSAFDNCLNSNIELEEMDLAIRKLKNNKSVSCDLISNEMLKGSNLHLRKLILKLFNGCLENGSYPWIFMSFLRF